MSSYIVAIVGRPNVGKSTLFNRIVGSRDAIVHDTPGVTRDRKYAPADWAGKNFTLIDTGGYMPDAVDEIGRAIREQARIAIDEASAVIFVVDALEGLTSLDRDIATILHKSNKKTYLVVNKVDNEKREPDVAEFFAVGLGDPLPLSALLGRRIGDFLDMLVADIDLDRDQQQDPRLKLAVIGKPNVGKSSLVNALAGSERSIVTPIPGTTRDPVDLIIRYYGEEILLVDTAGLRRKARVKESVEFYSALRTIRSVERCDVAAVLIDAEQGLDKQDLRIIQDVADRKRSMVLVVNKWDLIEKDEKTAQILEKMIRETLRIYAYVPIIFVSAQTKQRIFKLLDVVKSVYAESIKRIPTHELNEIVLADIKRRPPSSSSGKEIKVKYITQVRTHPPTFAFFVNEPKLIQEAYKRFLEGRIREHFNFTGVPLTIHFRRRTK